MRYYLIILMVVLTFSCSENRVPKGILKEKEMTPVLVEIHLAEAIFAQRYAQETTRENYQEDLYLSILKKYKLDRKVFEKSVLYYGKHPDKYKLVYDEVLNRLSEMSAKSRAKDSIQSKIMKTETIPKDSILINKLKAASRTKDSIQTIRTKDSIQAIKLKAETRAKDSIQAKKLKGKQATQEAVKINKTKVKSGSADSAKKVKPAAKDTVQLIK
jgi:hypothetical protein